jgi:hypothetical protein
VGHARVWGLGAFIVLLPISVEIPAARDSVSPGSETRVTLTRGMGTYAIIDRGCEGQVLRTHPHTFVETSLEVRHRFKKGFTIGASGGRVHDRAGEPVTVQDDRTDPYAESTFVQLSGWESDYVIPQIGIEARSAGVGLGWIFSDEPHRTGIFQKAGGEPAFHFRIGRLDGLHFRFSWLETVPLYSSGRFFDVGVGAHPGRLWDFYAGVVAGGPFDGPGLTLKLERRIQEHLTLAGNARFGYSGFEPQNGFALSMGYISASPVEPEPGMREPRRPMGSAWGLAPRPAKADSLAHRGNRENE